MRYIILILLTALLLGGAYFYTLNPTAEISQVELGFVSYYDVSMYWLVFVAVLFGIVWALLVFIVQELRLRFKLLTMRSENTMLRKELDALRLLPLSEINLDSIEKEKK